MQETIHVNRRNIWDWMINGIHLAPYILGLYPYSYSFLLKCICLQSACSFWVHSFIIVLFSYSVLVILVDSSHIQARTESSSYYFCVIVIYVKASRMICTVIRIGNHTHICSYLLGTYIFVFILRKNFVSYVRSLSLLCTLIHVHLQI